MIGVSIGHPFAFGKAAEFTNHFTYVMLLVAWFNWDKALSSTKFSIQETARDDYY
jgi:hypothetical protein